MPENQPRVTFLLRKSTRKRVPDSFFRLRGAPPLALPARGLPPPGPLPPPNAPPGAARGTPWRAHPSRGPGPPGGQFLRLLSYTASKVLFSWNRRSGAETHANGAIEDAMVASAMELLNRTGIGAKGPEPRSGRRFRARCWCENPGFLLENQRFHVDRLTDTQRTGRRSGLPSSRR